MAKITDPAFKQGKNNVIDNLEAIRMTLDQCIADGMLDEENYYFNEILDLIDEAHVSKTPPDLGEVIVKAKSLETDFDAWLSLHRHETLSLAWPAIKTIT